MQVHQRLRLTTALIAQRSKAAIICSLGLLAAGPAMAQTPQPWQTGFQPAHSPVMQGIEGLHSLVLC